MVLLFLELAPPVHRDSSWGQVPAECLAPLRQESGARRPWCWWLGMDRGLGGLGRVRLCDSFERGAAVPV